MKALFLNSEDVESVPSVERCIEIMEEVIKGVTS